MRRHAPQSAFFPAMMSKAAMSPRRRSGHQGHGREFSSPAGKVVVVVKHLKDSFRAHNPARAATRLRVACGDGRFAQKPDLLDRIQNPARNHGKESPGAEYSSLPDECVLPLIVIKEHTGGTVQLGDDHTLSTVDDKRTVSAS